MISIIDKERIYVLWFKEHKSKRSISMELKIHRSTVANCINEFDRKFLALGLNPGVEKFDFEKYIKDVVKESEYRLRTKKRGSEKLTEECLENIRCLLKQYPDSGGMNIYKQIKSKQITHIKNNYGNNVKLDFNLAYSTFLKGIKIVEEGKVKKPDATEETKKQVRHIVKRLKKS